MKYILKSPAHLLLFLWIPLSCGTFIGAGQGSGTLPIQHVFILLFYISSAIILIKQRRILKVNKNFLVLIAYITVVGAVSNYESTDFWLKLFSFIGVILTATLITRSCSFHEFIEICFRSLGATFILSIFFIALFPSISISEMEGKQVMHSFYDQKNTYGRLLYFLCFFYLLSANGAHSKKNMLFILTALFVTLFFSQSRTSLFIALLIAAIFFALKYSNTLLRIMKPAISLPLALLLAIVIAYLSEMNDIGSNFDYISIAGIELALTGRATIWANVIKALTIENKWLFGFGLEGFYSTTYSHYVTGIGLGSFVPNDSHNGYVDLLLNFGVLGGAIYFSMMANLLINTYRIKGDRIARIALVIFLILFALTNLTESFFVKTSNITSFLFICFYLYSTKMSAQNARAR